MNPDEQRERKGAYERLAKRVEDLELLVAQLITNQNALMEVMKVIATCTADVAG